MKTLSDAERLDWLQLIRTNTIGPITFYRMIAKFGSAADALRALPDLSKSSGRKRPLIAPSRDDVERELDAATAIGATAIASCEPDYPRCLAAIPDAPPIIFARGHTSLFEKPGIAIVGARNASAAGRRIARDFSQGLGAEGYVVISGLARGIDGVAHAGALDTGTIAVVAGGLDVIYPPEHRDLMDEIGARGLIISERAPGTQPTSRDFPRRNRLISGLSRGVVVVEAAARSGTLITARFALEQGREVFAVPGSPLDPRCQGANTLIRDGATLVQNPADIIVALAAQTFGAAEGKDLDALHWASPDAQTSHDDAEKITALVREALSYTPIHRDEILREIDAPIGLILDALMTLVISGDAQEHSGGPFTQRMNE